MQQRTDYLSKEVIEENCNCAGIFLVKETSTPSFKYGKSGYLTPSVSVLLVESKRKNYQYSFPKGKRNKGEITLDAAKRELYEETGLHESDYQLVPDKYYIEYRNDINKPHIVYYMAKLINPDAKLCPLDTREIVSAKWFSPEEIYTMRRSFYLQRRQIVTRGVRDYLMRFVLWRSRKMKATNKILVASTATATTNVPALSNVA